jgi:hypothetical protein
MPSASVSACEAFAVDGQLSQALPTPSPSPSVWVAFFTATQLSTPSARPSSSRSRPIRVPDPGGAHV